MKKWFTMLLCLMLLLAQAAAAEEAGLGRYARLAEDEARQAGQEVFMETTFAWGGLPLLDDKLNTALESLLKTLRVAVSRQGVADHGYVGLDARLKDVSVLDMLVMARDGVYYEESNLLGGQTVAFSMEEFSDFSRALSERTGGVLPQNLQWLFELVIYALGGGERIALDAELLDSAMVAFDSWRGEALETQERLRPSVWIPGVYGARATVVDVTREEAVALAEAFVGLVSGENALWESAVRAQVRDGDENKVKDVLAQARETLAALPDAVGGWLPEMADPAEYREVFGREGELVAKQVEMSLAGDVSLLLEWVPADRGVPSFYAALAAGESRAELLLTREDGALVTIGSVTRQRNRYVAECTLEDPGLTLAMIMTRTENYELRENKETLTAKTDWTLESERLLGEGAIVTLSAGETDTASGAGEKYSRKHVTTWTIKGLGFDNRKILTATTTTTLREANPSIAQSGVLRPAQFTGEELDAWLTSVEVSSMQAFFTCLGRLPPDVAAYLLPLLQ